MNTNLNDMQKLYTYTTLPPLILLFFTNYIAIYCVPINIDL